MYCRILLKKKKTRTVSNVAEFRLPDPAGRAGGACTSTLLNVVYKDQQDTRSDMSYKQVIDAMRVILEEKQYTQIPQVREKATPKKNTKFSTSIIICLLK